MSPLFVLAGGCGFTAGSFPDATVGPIEANAVACDCRFADSGSRTLRIQASSDDAEQSGTVMDLTSTDLDLAEKHVGVRFDKLGLPPGAVIQSAHIQFEADATQNDPTSLVIRAQALPDAPAFTTAANNITGRTPLAGTAVPWTIGAWSSGAAGSVQRTPDLSPLLQELVDLQGWSSASPVVLIFIGGTGHRTAESFDGGANAAPQLVVTFDTELAAEIPTCATNLDRDANGFLISPQATCDTLETTLGGLNAACQLPQTVNCTAVNRKDPNQADIPDSYQSEVCLEPCDPNPVDAPTCNEYDPVEFVACLERGNPLANCKTLHASATHAGTDTPVCVSSGSPLAFHAFGRRSRCEVEGTSEILIGDREPEQDPATAGSVEILGGPCPGDDCRVHSSFAVDMEPITFEVRFARDPTFTNLGAAGSARETTLLDAGVASFDPDTVGGTGTGRRGSDGLAIAASNSDVVEVGVDWMGRTCDMTGTLAVGVGDDGLCEADGTTVCGSDAECSAVGGACVLPPNDDAEMSVGVTLVGDLVNQPPDALAGADQAIECTSSAGGTFDLDGRGSSDPDGNLALASWRAGSRTGSELSDDLRTTQALGVGDTQSYVLRVVDTFAQLDEDATSVSVVDTTPPSIACNAPATIRPRDAVATFAATATDVCDTSVAAAVTSYDCFAIKSNGRRMSKLESCEVSFAADTLRVEDVGGIGDHITWTVQAVDDAGNVGSATCEVIIRR
ncbi:MAG: hypothetical protein Q8P18_32265 [Pseudomonadota bacterium]|nr:hypothetical protein [Pseudomonadota bacterium]